MDAVMIVDLSGSTSEVRRHYGMLVNLARAIAVGLPVTSGHARLGVVTYDTTARDQFHLSTYDRDVEALLNALEFNHGGGTTNTQAALDLAATSQVLDTPTSRLFNAPTSTTRRRYTAGFAPSGQPPLHDALVCIVSAPDVV